MNDIELPYSPEITDLSAKPDRRISATAVCGSIPAFVINLDRSPDRLTQITRQFRGQHMDFERVSAVDGRERETVDFPEYDAARAKKFLGRSLNAPEIACYLSHLRAARQFLATGAPIGMVVEDDATFAGNMPALLEQFAGFTTTRECPPWHVINLGANRIPVSSRVRQLGAFELRRAHQFPVTTTGLLWSREGAAALLEEGSTVFATFDGFLRYWLTRSNRGLVFAPSPVRAARGVSQISVNPGQANRNRFGRSRLYWVRKQQRLLADKAFALWHKLHSARPIHGSVRLPKVSDASGTISRAAALFEGKLKVAVKDVPGEC